MACDLEIIETEGMPAIAEFTLTCNLCTMDIHAGEAFIDITGFPVCLHVDCYNAWTEEVF